MKKFNIIVLLLWLGTSIGALFASETELWPVHMESVEISRDSLVGRDIKVGDRIGLTFWRTVGRPTTINADTGKLEDLAKKGEGKVIRFMGEPVNFAVFVPQQKQWYYLGSERDMGMCALAELSEIAPGVLVYSSPLMYVDGEHVLKVLDGSIIKKALEEASDSNKIGSGR